MAKQDTRQQDAGAEPRPHDEEPQDFAASMERLEMLVEQLESGELSLEASLEAFERGVVLARDAQRRLNAAELKVRSLTESQDGGMQLTPFSTGEENPVENDGEG